MSSPVINLNPCEVMVSSQHKNIKVHTHLDSGRIYLLTLTEIAFNVICLLKKYQMLKSNHSNTNPRGWICSLIGWNWRHLIPPFNRSNWFDLYTCGGILLHLVALEGGRATDGKHTLNLTCMTSRGPPPDTPALVTVLLTASRHHQCIITGSPQSASASKLIVGSHHRCCRRVCA